MPGDVFMLGGVVTCGVTSTTASMHPGKCVAPRDGGSIQVSVIVASDPQINNDTVIRYEKHFVLKIDMTVSGIITPRVGRIVILPTTGVNLGFIRGVGADTGHTFFVCKMPAQRVDPIQLIRF